MMSRNAYRMLLLVSLRRYNEDKRSLRLALHIAQTMYWWQKRESLPLVRAYRIVGRTFSRSHQRHKMHRLQ